MKSSLHRGDSVDSLPEANSIESSGPHHDLSHYGEGSFLLDSTPNLGNGKLLNQEGVFQLSQDVRTFSEALNLLRDVFIEEKGVYSGSLIVLAHERLGELLQILRTIVDNYPEINSADVLTAAGDLIKHVKEYNYDDDDSVSTEIFRLINSLAMTFSSCVSECLTGDDINSPSIMQIPSPSFEMNPSKAGIIESDEISPGLSDTPDASQIEGDIDGVLSQLDNGIELALSRAKVLSKYLGDLISYVKKKAHLEMEHSRNIVKLSAQTKTILSDQSFLPFQSLYCTSLEHEREYAVNCQSVYQAIHGKYADSLQTKKNEHDKVRKNIRESWARDRKRSEEAVAGMKKAKQSYFTKMQEYQKAKEAAVKAEEEQGGQGQQGLKVSGTSSAALSALYSGSVAGKVDRKKKQEEDTNLKALIAVQAYKGSIGEANKRTRDLDKNKIKYLQQVRELIFQCDQTAKAATLEFFQLHHQLYAALPVQFQAMYEDAKRYEPGLQYSEFVRNLPLHPNRPRESFHFENFPINGPSYGGQGGLSETESISSRSLDDLSPSGADSFRANLTRRHSTDNSLSSDDILDDIKPPVTLTGGDTGFDSSPVPIRTFTKTAFKAAKEAFKGKKSSKSTLFGVDFSVACQGCPDGVPFLVKKCVAEIDNRALTTKGIYRKNGVKNRVDKICAQFDTAPDRIDLSPYTPHDVTGGLKSFLRQLPESLMLFRYYDTFLDIGKDYSQLTDPAASEQQDSQTEDADGYSPPYEVAEPYIMRLRDAVEQLPMENRNTLQCIVSHLSRIADHSYENKMTSGNLAIVFGPTLLRRSLIDLNEPLGALIDLSYQSTVIRMLIMYKDAVFDIHPLSPEGAPPTSSLPAGNELPATDKSDDQLDTSEGSSQKAQSPAPKHESREEQKLEQCSDEHRPIVPRRSRVNLDHSQSESSYPTPRSSVVDAVQPNDHAPPAGSRKIAITDDTLPPVNQFDLPPPPLPSRRRKKSRRTSEDQANKSQNPESSPIFSHNSFQSGFDRLGNLARRISREKLSSRKTSEVDGEFSFDASPPSSRKHSCFNPQSVLVLQEASVDSENERDAASFC